MNRVSAIDGEPFDQLRLVWRNTVATMAAKLGYLLTRVLLPPLVLAHVSLDQYGLWSVCFVAIAYLGMSSFGATNVYVRYVAEYQARGETVRINRLMATGVLLMLGVSATLLGGFTLALPYVLDWFQVAPALRAVGFDLMFWSAALFLADMSVGAFSSALMGLQRIAGLQVIWATSYLLEAAAIVVLLWYGVGIYALLWAFILRYVFAITMSVFLCYRALPSLSVHPRHFDRAAVRLFFGYGAVVQISSVVSAVLHSLERVVAGHWLGPRATGLFDLGQKLPMMANHLPSSLNGVLLPAMSHMHTVADHDRLVDLYLRGSRYISLAMGVIQGFLAAFAGPLLTVWIGPDPAFSSAVMILIWFTAAYHLTDLTGPGSAVHRGMAKPERELWYPLGMLVCVVSCLAVGWAWGGMSLLLIAGIVAASKCVSALGYMMYTNYTLQVPPRTFMYRVLLPGAFPYIVAVGVRWMIDPALAWSQGSRWLLLVLVGISGCLYVGLVGVMAFHAVCDDAERAAIRRTVSRLGQWSMQWGGVPA